MFWDDPLAHQASTVDPIESLVLLNPAFGPFELEYSRRDRDDSHSDEAMHRASHALEWVPRKALVYSNHDMPNGTLFDLTEIVLRRSVMEEFLQHASSKRTENDTDVFRSDQPTQLS